MNQQQRVAHLVDEVFLLTEEIKRLQAELKPLKEELKELAEEHMLTAVTGEIGLATFQTVATPDRANWKAIWQRFDKAEWIQEGLLTPGGTTVRMNVLELSSVASKMDLAEAS
jgi:hypothetical protein